MKHDKKSAGRSNAKHLEIVKPVKQGKGPLGGKMSHCENSKKDKKY